MPRSAGMPKVGGRKKGTPNKASIQRAQEIAASGLTPLDYLINVLRDEQRLPAERMEAAKSAAPYVHPRLAAVEHSGSADNPITFTILSAVPRSDDEEEDAHGYANGADH